MRLVKLVLLLAPLRQKFLIKQVIQRLQDWGAQAPKELDGREENITFSLPKELRIHVTQA